MIIHNGNSIPVVGQAQDPGDSREYQVILRPPVWQADEVYYDNESAVIPSTFRGFYYVAQSGGKSGTSEPDFPAMRSKTVRDGDVLWRAIPYTLALRPGKNIASVLWSADQSGVSISSVQNTSDTTTATLSNFPTDVSKVLITVHFVYSNGEEEDRSFYIPVRAL